MPCAQATGVILTCQNQGIGLASPLRDLRFALVIVSMTAIVIDSTVQPDWPIGLHVLQLLSIPVDYTEVRWKAGMPCIYSTISNPLSN